MPICSLKCEDHIPCLVTEAARATSAAPTYFPVLKIGDRYLQDGGMEFNNPSFAIYSHYKESSDITNARGMQKVSQTTASSTRRHGDLNFLRVRMVNLGTGTKSLSFTPPPNSRFVKLVPGFIRMSIFLKRSLLKCAVDSEKIANVMNILAESTGAGGDTEVKYKRFSADTGVCFIVLDDYKALENIESLTRQYLDRPEVQEDLKGVGEEIARQYLQKQHEEASVQPATYANMAGRDPSANNSEPESQPLAPPVLPAFASQSAERRLKDTHIEVQPPPDSFTKPS